MSLTKLAAVTVGLLSVPPASPPDRVKQLAALNIFEYPADRPAVAVDALKASALQPGDIAEDFSNLGDLAWLEPVAKRNKVFFVGETHYSRGIHQLAHRMLFALNTFDHYGLVSLEFPYSDGLFLNHYLELRDEARAEQFLAESAGDLNVAHETLAMVRAIRRWNRAHPAKPIRVAAHDIEHDWRGALRRVVVPYLCGAGAACALDPAALDKADLGRRVAELTRQVATSPAKGFFTRNDVLAVLSNIEAKWEVDEYEEEFYRQKAIVRNLTDPARLGRFLRSGKAMVWGGSHHATTRYAYPKGANFFREGSYLNHDFAPTRGRTYSVLIWSLAFNFADVAGADVSRCVSRGYRTTVQRFQTALARGLASASGNYRFDNDFALIDRLVLARAADIDHAPMRIHRVDWERLLAQTSGEDRDQLGRRRKQFTHHDAWFAVPRSPIITKMCATPPTAKAAAR